MADDPVTLETLGIGWVTKLREVATVGPAKYVYRKITTFVLGTVVGFALNLGETLRESFGAVEESFRFAGDQAGSAFESGGDAVLDAAGIAGELARSLGESAGPFAPLIVVGLVVVLAALIIRVYRASLDNIPVVGTIKRILIG